MGKESRSAARERAAAARAAQLAQEKHDKVVRILVIVGVLVIVVGIVGGALFTSRKSTPNTQPTPNSSAAMPAGVTTAGYSIGTTTQGVPNVTLWEDFQCPGCKNFNQVFDADLNTWVKEGKINLVYSPATFLDSKNTTTNANSSSRAVAAFGCAIDAGKGTEYIPALYALQPAVEGDGYSDQQLLDAGVKAGINGTAYETFASCVQSGKYMSWAANSNQNFTNAGITTTPTLWVNGKTLDTAKVTTPAELLAAIQAAAK